LLSALAVSTTAFGQTSALRLEEAVRLALSRNERARIATLNVTAAEAGVERARAGFLPTLNVSGTDTRRFPIVTHKGATPQSGGSSQSGNSGTATATLTEPVINASAWPLHAEAKEQLESQRAQSADDQRLLGFDAAHAFFDVLSAAGVLDAALRRQQSAEANLADTAARVQAELASSNDATRAEIDVANAAREVELDRGNLASAMLNLSFVINAPVRDVVARPESTLELARRRVPETDALVRIAVARRPDLVAKYHAAAAAHDFADEPLLRLLPTLNVTAQSQAATSLPSTGVTLDASVGANLSWTLYDAGIRYADKHLRDANAKIADLTFESLVRAVRSDVHASVVSLESQQAAFRGTERAVEASRRSAEETQILYKQGLAKAIELVDANDSRFQAEVAYAVAEYAMARAYLDLRQALGLDALGTELR
jgi:outer membrane protein TolC